MLLLLLFACGVVDSESGVDRSGGDSAAYTACPLAYEDLASSWGLVDTTDDLPYPNDGGGVTIADLDEDGLDDVVLAVRSGTTVIHWNRGDRFEQEALEQSFPGNHVAAIDVNGDRHLDLLVSGTRSDRATPDFVLLPGDGAGRFAAPESLPTPTGSILSVDAADYDHDGDLDLYVATGGRDDLLVNDGSGGFISKGEAALAVDAWTWRSWVGLWLDANNDGWADLLVGNDLQSEFGPTRFYNNAAGVLTEVTAPITVNAMGGSVLDYNNDGALDVYITGTGPDGLYSNDGSGGWFDAATAAGAVGTNDVGRMHLGSVAFDADNDGWTDLAVVGGRFGIDDRLLALQDVVEPDSLLLNRDGMFMESAADVGFGDNGDGKAVAAGDLDGDGILELVVTQLGQPSHVYRTACTGSRTLVVELVGKSGNTYGIGARVDVHTSEGERRAWVGTLQGINANGPPRAHIGLGAAEVEGITVYWPSGRVQDVDVSEAGRIVVEEDSE